MDFLLKKDQQKKIRKISKRLLDFFKQTVGRGTQTVSKNVKEGLNGSTLFEAVPDMNSTQWMWVVIVMIISFYFLYKVAFYMVLGFIIYIVYNVWKSQ
jgi:ABC-type proline/glycine betaine transport system permease subunit